MKAWQHTTGITGSANPQGIHTSGYSFMQMISVTFAPVSANTLGSTVRRRFIVRSSTCNITCSLFPALDICVWPSKLPSDCLLLSPSASLAGSQVPDRAGGIR